MPPPTALMQSSADTPLDPRVAREAAQWLMRVHPSAQPDAAEVRAFLHWRASDEKHELAWQRAQQLTARFDIMPPDLGKATLGRTTGKQRRIAMKKLALLLTLAPATLLAYQKLPVAAWQAEFRTKTGERRHVQLADGSRVYMNTATAFDIVFDDNQRLVVLHEGELLIETARDAHPSNRPFNVQTADGGIRAIGTKFSVKRLSNWSDVAVFEGAVEVNPNKDSGLKRIVSANSQLRFSSTRLFDTEILDAHAADWTDGTLHASNMRLGDFVAELTRYRRGWLRCDSAVADLRISGSFQLDDTDETLKVLVATLPIRVTFHTRYITTIQPA